MNFEPLESIDVRFSTYPESVSVVSQLNRLWDPDNTGTTAPDTLPQNTVIIDAQRQSQLASSETDSCINPSSELHVLYHIDSERDKQMNAFSHTDGVVRHNGDPLARSSPEEVNDQLGSKLDVRLEEALPTGDMYASTMFTSRFFAPHQTAVHKYHKSSASVESDQAYSLDVTSGGVTDSSGYIVCSAQAEKDQT